ncbi:TOP2 [Acrasis kona]|uniref:DNA topoisomerase (ATP-hydrolyzing) n=1 Tax=Acrasis kona TaxID=1008807 RepID=A0AAW2ZP22_9EUKA
MLRPLYRFLCSRAITRFRPINRCFIPKAPICNYSVKSKSVENTYVKKTQIEHVLERPDTYVGTTETINKTMFVLQDDKIVKKDIKFVPALYRIIDELLMNAVDNHVRSGTGTNEIKFELDAENGTVSVQNNGKSIPLSMHEKEKVYVPELVFGNLLTGSNFDDKEVKFTGGRNGYGAKLANIFSKKFKVEISDGENLYKQEWINNMSTCKKPTITKKSQPEYIRVTVHPDFEKFGLEGFDEEFTSLLYRRVHDLAGCNDGLKVWLNKKVISSKGFKSFVNNIDPAPLVYKKLNSHFEIAVGAADSYTHLTFVNSICTYGGGTHLNFISSQIVKK